MQEEHKEGDPFCGEGRVVNSGPELDNLTSEEARRKLLHILGEQGVGGEYTNYRLRDWLISRQRYTHTHTHNAQHTTLNGLQRGCRELVQTGTSGFSAGTGHCC